jgi:hypothetical protein
MIFGTPPIVTNGLVLHLDAGNRQSYVSGSTTWRDLSGNGNNGTLAVTGSNTRSASFNNNNQGNIIFSGSGSYIDTPFSASIGTTLYSYGCWFKFTANQLGALVSKRVGTPTFEQFTLYIAGDSIGNTTGSRIVINDVQNDQTFTNVRLGITSGSYNDNNWHYATAVRSTNNTLLYIDGILQATTNTTSIPNLTTTSKLVIGIVVNNQTILRGADYNGSIANVQIYNRALSPAEISQNYNALKTRFGLT